MPRALPRPTKEELATLSAFIRVASAEPKNRWRAVAVESWANGRTSREAAADANALFKAAGEAARGNQSAASRAIRLYQQHGLDGFRRKASLGGRLPIPPEKTAMVVALLEEAFARGAVLTYSAVAQQVGISKSKVAQIAKAKRLDAKNRRGRVAKTARPEGQGP